MLIGVPDLDSAPGAYALDPCERLISPWLSFAEHPVWLALVVMVVPIIHDFPTSIVYTD